MRILTIAAVFLILVVYARYYWTFPNHVQLIQVPAHAFQESLLHEKSPIVIDSCNAHDYDVLLNHVFKSQGASGIVRSAWMVARARNHDPCTVLLQHPHTDDPITIRLQPDQILFIPFQWRCDSDTDCTLLNYWDVAHAIALILAPFACCVFPMKGQVRTHGSN